MIWAGINYHHRAIWYVVPKEDGKKGMDAEQYIELMKKFRADLEEREIDTSKIIYQQGEKLSSLT